MWQLHLMPAAMDFAPDIARPDLLESLRKSSEARCQQLLDACYQFRRWEIDNMLSGEPSGATVNYHRETLSGLIKTVDLLTALSAHPDSFEKPFHDKLKLLGIQLRHSWDKFHNPMSPEESAQMDKALATIFPE
jgi:hypothetical protein